MAWQPRHRGLLKTSHKRPETRQSCASRLYQAMQVIETSLQAGLPAAQGRLEAQAQKADSALTGAGEGAAG